jgi:hypothetical protein
VSSRRRWTIQFCALAIGVGLMAGMLTPKPSGAVSLYNIYLHPTADTLTCGWHNNACWNYPTPVASGWALDWATTPSSDFYVYFFTKSDNGAGSGTAGTGTVIYSSPNECQHLTGVIIKDLGGIERGRVQYDHTVSIATSSIIPIQSGYTPQLTSAAIGDTADEGPPPEDGGECAWYGFHVHEAQVSGASWTKLNYPDEDTCNSPNLMTDCGIYNINLYAMLKLAFSY